MEAAGVPFDCCSCENGLLGDFCFLIGRILSRGLKRGIPGLVVPTSEGSENFAGPPRVDAPGSAVQLREGSLERSLAVDLAARDCLYAYIGI